MGEVAIITARGGSKRMPRKNVKDFCGMPIIAYSIRAALESELFDEVMVSTDDDEIASVALKFGASVPFMRSSATSGDHTPTYEVIREVISCYDERDFCFDTACCIYPTAPFVTADRLRAACELLRDPIDTVFSVTSFTFPPQRGLVEENGYMRYWLPENAETRSQDLEPIFHDAGQFYYLNIPAFKDRKCLIGQNAKGFMLPPSEVQDIDTYDDWKIAEMKYERMLLNHE